MRAHKIDGLRDVDRLQQSSIQKIPDHDTSIQRASDKLEGILGVEYGGGNQI